MNADPSSGPPTAPAATGDRPSSPLVELRGISRSFGGVQALADVDLTLHGGEVHALVGENGAGKSTLVKILTGVEQPDSGEIVVAGEPQRLGDPQAAHRLGIAAMYQEPTVFLDLGVAENIFAGRRPRGLLGSVDWSAMRREAEAALAQIGVDFAADTPVRGLGVADRQLLEIAKALSAEARLLIMDEPTAALSSREVENLFAITRRLCERGVGILFVSHRLEEISAISDVVTVLRDGRHVATRAASELTHGEIIRLMVGRSLDALFPKEEAEIGEPVLVLEGFTRHGVFSDVSFEVRRGEIVGLAGLVGAGRSEVARSLFGIDPHDEGEVFLAGERFRPRSPRASMRRGLAYLPEDRLAQGLVQPMSVAENASMAILPELTPGGFLRPRNERRLARRFMAELRIKAVSPAQPVLALSGGTQQKVVLSKWLAAEPRVLILDEPTRGVDVGTKADVHRTISHLATQGLAILLISSELPEILGMSDRVVVMREGRVVEELSREDATSERVIEAATGVAAGAAA
jgi:rhamnose transport system ATP-binding protein